MSSLTIYSHLWACFLVFLNFKSLKSFVLCAMKYRDKRKMLVFWISDSKAKNLKNTGCNFQDNYCFALTWEMFLKIPTFLSSHNISSHIIQKTFIFCSKFNKQKTCSEMWINSDTAPLKIAPIELFLIKLLFKLSRNHRNKPEKCVIFI